MAPSIGKFILSGQFALQIKKIKLISLFLFGLCYSSLQAKSLSGQDLKVFNQANIAMSQHSWEQAEKLLSQLHEQFPANDYVSNNLAVTYFNQGRLDEAQDLFSQIIGSTEPTRTAFQNLQTLYGYSAAKAYSKGLNLLKPIELPSMIVRAYDGKNMNNQPLSKAAESKVLTKHEPSSNDMVAMLNSDPAKPVKESTQRPELSESAVNEQAIKKQSVKSTQNKKVLTVKKLIKNEVTTSETKQAKITPPDEELKITTESVKPNDKEILLAQLDAWAKAWSNGNIEAYIDFYSPNYSPRGQSRASWLKNRRSRVKSSKKIQIHLSKQEVFVNNNKSRANILFIQKYRSKNYQDKVKKRITWVKQKGTWVIAKEVIVKTL